MSNADAARTHAQTPAHYPTLRAGQSVGNPVNTCQSAPTRDDVELRVESFAPTPRLTFAQRVAIAVIVIVLGAYAAWWLPR